MELTLGEVAAAFKALVRLASPEKEMPIMAAIKVKRLIDALKDNAKIGEDAGNDLIRKYGKDMGDGTVQIRQQDGEAFVSYMKELVEVSNDTVDLDIDPFPISLLGDKISISVSDLAALEKMITP